MKRKYRYAILLGIILTVGLLSGCGTTSSRNGSVVRGGRTPAAAETEADQTQSSNDTQQEKQNKKEELYRIAAIDTEQSVIRFESLDTGKEIQYTYTGATYIYDKNDVSKTVESLYSGETVTFQVDDQTEKLQEVKASDALWLIDGVDNFTIEEKQGAVTVGTTRYALAENLRVFSGNDTIQLSQVSSNDTITLIGDEKEIISIVVENGHGTVKLTNTKLFEGGWLTIGKRISMEITKDMEVELPEGTYTLAVANDGYGDATEITVDRGGILQVDCNTLKGEGPKYCNLSFQFPQEDIEVYLDNEKQDYSKPIKLKYGIYQLTLKSETYGSWSKRLMVSSEKATISIDLQEVLEAEAEAAASASTESSSSSSSSSTGTTNSSSSSSGGTTNNSSSNSSSGTTSSSSNSSSGTTNNSSSNSSSGTTNSSSSGSTGTTNNSSSSLIDTDTLSTISNLLDIINGSSSSNSSSLTDSTTTTGN